MAPSIIIIFCSLLLIAYLFNLSASRTRIPSVILLLLLGWSTKQATILLNVELPKLTPLLPLLATIGLILIVLEGSLELKLEKEQLSTQRKSFLGALIPMILVALGISYALQYFGGYSPKIALLNAIPMSVISSAIAIPGVVNLVKPNRDFIIYESSFSDILGVLFFNFMVMKNPFSLGGIGRFGGQILLILLVSFVATLGLYLLLRKIQHHVKFVPIILLIILVYAVMKVYHLPALIFILVFGLSMGNIELFKQIKFLKNYKVEGVKKEINKFREMTIEGTFLVKALFFILFGYTLETSDILNEETFIWAAGIVSGILIIRIVQLKISKMKLFPLLFVAPRGLITILLFLAIGVESRVDLVNNSLIVQVILLSILVMTFGVMFTSSSKPEKITSLPREEESS